MQLWSIPTPAKTFSSINTNRIDTVFFNANHLEWTAKLENTMTPFSEDTDTKLDGATLMEKILIDQKTMKDTELLLQIKEAQARMRAKERAPGRCKFQK